MMTDRLREEAGFSLVELTIVLVVIGILAAVAMQSMTALVEDTRRTKTEREMEMLAESIVGDPAHVNEAGRSDFGYVGDIGAFPPNLDALLNNPGGYTTWDGPYIPAGFTQDVSGFKTDEWGQPYNYSGGITITSTGSGSTITKKIADAASDYLLNTVNGTIKDANDSVPGLVYRDSVDIKITIPDGAGGTVTKAYQPDSAGAFTLDSLPVGRHELRIIYTPEVDTLFRNLTVLPRHKSTAHYKFAAAYFAGGGTGGCGGSGTLTLRPNGVGSSTQLGRSGCSANWNCVEEDPADDWSTYVYSQGSSYRRDTYAMENPTDTSCNIQRVTVYCRANKITIWYAGYVKLVLRTGGTTYESSSQVVTSSFANYSNEWATNPFTGVAWTWSDIEALEAGVSLQTYSPLFTVNCTQVWVVVDYGP